jgi:hypothetical protein
VADADARAAHGREAKNLIDAGRCEFLRAVLDAAAPACRALVGIGVFCSPALSPENRLLLAAP